jgi:four helix bundle protein
VTSNEQEKPNEGERNGTKPRTRSYRDLIVWQKGMVLVRNVYELTRGFPSEEKYGLVSQMRRAAVSIPSNVAEGQARKSTAEFVQFISTAEGSAAELDTQAQLSMDLGFLTAGQAAETFRAIDEIRRMLNGLRRTLLKR